MTTKETQLLEEKIKNKLIAAEENRIEKLNSITERLKEHESHVEEVRKATTNNKEEMEEKIIQKLQNALNYRSEQLETMKEKIRDHVIIHFFFIKGYLLNKFLF